MSYYNGQIGCGWYEETEEDIEHKRLQNIAALTLKQKLDEIFAINAEKFKKGELKGIRAGDKMLNNIWR